MGSKLIPNTFQTPNVYIDKLACLLTPQEFVVLVFATREILGWYNKIESRRARIALSVFTEGKIHSETGEQLARGCGLGTSAVRHALESLGDFNVLVKVGQDARPKGQMYQLQTIFEVIDWNGLEDRKEKKKDRDRKRTAKSRNVLSDKRLALCCGTEDYSSVGQHNNVLSDHGKETQGNTEETHMGADAQNTKPHTADEETKQWIQDLENEPTPSPAPARTAKSYKRELLATETQMLTRALEKPWATWGEHSKEAQAQLTRRDGMAQSLRRLGYELDTTLGLRPLWKQKRSVASWFVGLANCLAEAEGDVDLVLEAANHLREQEMTISSPHSLVKTTGALAAKRRSGNSGVLKIGL